MSARELPPLARIRQRFGGERIDDVVGAVHAAVADSDVGGRLRPGARVAITAGSRGIHQIPIILGALVAALRELGAELRLLRGRQGGQRPHLRLRLLDRDGEVLLRRL